MIKVFTSYWWNLKRLYPDGPPPGVAIVQVSRSHRGYPGKYIAYNSWWAHPTREESAAWKSGQRSLYINRLNRWRIKYEMERAGNDGYYTIILACVCAKDCHREAVWEALHPGETWTLDDEIKSSHGGRASLGPAAGE